MHYFMVGPELHKKARNVSKLSYVAALEEVAAKLPAWTQYYYCTLSNHASFQILGGNFFIIVSCVFIVIRQQQFLIIFLLFNV